MPADLTKSLVRGNYHATDDVVSPSLIRIVHGGDWVILAGPLTVRVETGGHAISPWQAPKTARAGIYAIPSGQQYVFECQEPASVEFPYAGALGRDVAISPVEGGGVVPPIPMPSISGGSLPLLLGGGIAALGLVVVMREKRGPRIPPTAR